VDFKKTTECVWWRTSTNTRWEWVPDWCGTNAETTGDKGYADWGMDNKLGWRSVCTERAGIW